MTLDSASVEGVEARVTVEETLARIDLPRPLAPGDSTTFRVHFRVGIPSVFDRFGHSGSRYSIAQWYPKMVVIDEKGWALDPYHYFAEFYGEFATYDVAITLPDEQWWRDRRARRGERREQRSPSRADLGRQRDVRVRAVVVDSLAGQCRARRSDWSRSTASRSACRAIPPRLARSRGSALHYRYAGPRARTPRRGWNATGKGGAVLCDSSWPRAIRS